MDESNDVFAVSNEFGHLFDKPETNKEDVEQSHTFSFCYRFAFNCALKLM